MGSSSAASFAVKGGRVWIDATSWKKNSPAIIARSNGLLRDAQGVPTLTVTPEAFLSKDSEMIACEVECVRDGTVGIYVELEIGGLN